MSEHPVLTLIRGKIEDSSRPFVLIAELEAQAGLGDEVAARIVASGAVEHTRQEPGCVAYELSRELDAPDRFVAYEAWRDLAALESHLATTHFAELGAALQGLLAGAPGLRILSPLSVPGQNGHHQTHARC